MVQNFTDIGKQNIDGYKNKTNHEDIKNRKNYEENRHNIKICFYY